MSMQQWKVVLSYLSNAVEVNGVKWIDAILFGGEPLVNPEVVVEPANTLQQFRNKGVIVKNSLVTNGSLLSEDLLRKLEGSLNTVQITLDGPQDRHDSLRHFSDGRGSYTEVMESLTRAARSSIPNVVVRVNFHMDQVGAVREFITSLARDLQDPSRYRMQFSKIAPPLSERYGSYSPPPDLEAVDVATMFQAESERVGFRVSAYSYFSGACTAKRSSNMVVDQDLKVFKCIVQMPHNVCAEFTSDGSLNVLDNKWFDLPLSIPDCVYECSFGPICGGGCPLAYFTEDRGKEGCEYWRYMAAMTVPVLSSKLQTITGQ